MMSAQLQESGAPAQDPHASGNPPSSASSATATATAAAAAAAPARPSALQNMAASGKSPYVQSQRDSPIRWQLYGQEAIDRAKTENKLIFLHIGYSASHYCHLTIQESFSNPHVVELLNESFVPVIVDRDERPDLDSIYVHYVQALTSAAGHPITAFLTPELEPVFGGSYFPPPGSHHVVPETGEEIADLLVVLNKTKSAWETSEAQTRASGRQAVGELRTMIGEGTLGPQDQSFKSAGLPNITEGRPEAVAAGEVDLDQLEEAYSHISRTFDKTNGGFLHMPRGAPPNFLSGNFPLEQVAEAYDLIKNTAKFITPAKLSFLLRASQFPGFVVDIIGGDLSTSCVDFALDTLYHIADGAIHDHLGGGFHHYSVTWDWSVPTFEKMLSDNALALGLYLDAWLLKGAPRDGLLAKTVLELADYLTSSPVLLEGGGFATSEAADSCNRRGDNTLRHGAYYLWTRKEFDTVIGNEQESSVAAAYWSVKEHGNIANDQDPNDEYLNQNVLRVVKNTAELASQFKISESEVVKLVDSAKQKLMTHREKERPRPALDTKVITAYNAMAIGSLARTYAACRSIGGIGRTDEYLAAAVKTAALIKDKLWDKEAKVLYRVYHGDGRGATQAFAEDYAFLIDGLLELYEVTGEETWLEWADELQSIQITKFYDHAYYPNDGSKARSGAFYRTAEGEANVLLRVKDAMDSVQPSENAVSAANLFRLGSLLDDERYTQLAVETVNAFEAEMLQYPYLFPGLLTSVVAWKLGVQSSVVMGGSEVDAKSYFLAPRGGLRTLLHYKPQSILRKGGDKRTKLTEQLSKLSPGLYSVEDDGLKLTP
ncbi:uncharacterized protein JN550_013044 [Neoarthrinium moseri]|uniref:uncharacterized protein n=1 Tax=Neoarthrinium moseri TaxID=1658444 RepID=UPI001FDE5B0F|nr:uncharacterized protein JN550_013044 [Neoarthrinium moseri]KAI1857781.1 hypothetical protein JN550_013044 [Neoarthrinium moseri]